MMTSSMQTGTILLSVRRRWRISRTFTGSAIKRAQVLPQQMWSPAMKTGYVRMVPWARTAAWMFAKNTARRMALASKIMLRVSMRSMYSRAASSK